MSEPSPFYQQHYAVEPPAIDEREFRAGWRRLTQLNKLHRYHAITDLEWRAGQHFYTIVEAADRTQSRAQSFDYAPGGSGFDGGLVRRLDAETRLNKLVRVLGLPRTKLLKLHIVEDLKWRELGRRLGVHPTTARRRTVSAIKQLTSVIWST